jgi:hypothetical protein
VVGNDDEGTGVGCGTGRMLGCGVGCRVGLDVGAAEGLAVGDEVMATHESQEAGQSHNHCMSPEVEVSAEDWHEAKGMSVLKSSKRVKRKKASAPATTRALSRARAAGGEGGGGGGGSFALGIRNRDP